MVPDPRRQQTSYPLVADQIERLKTAHSNAPRLLYDRKEAARQLSISVRSIDYLLAQKKFDTRRVGRKVLITHASLVRFAQSNHFEGVLPAPSAQKSSSVPDEPASA